MSVTDIKDVLHAQLAIPSVFAVIVQRSLI